MVQKEKFLNHEKFYGLLKKNNSSIKKNFSCYIKNNSLIRGEKYFRGLIRKICRSRKKVLLHEKKIRGIHEKKFQNGVFRYSNSQK